MHRSTYGNLGAAVTLGLAMAASALPAVAVGTGDTGAPTATGTWQKHQFSFDFLGFTTTYSCEGLADKLKLLLLASGARADVKSIPGACTADFGRPDKFARADLTYYTLAPAGDSPVAGQWRSVAFSTRSPRELEVGDCELVEQFRDKVLPTFTTRQVDDHTSCVPHQDSGSVIELKFEALTGMPPAKVGTTAAH